MWLAGKAEASAWTTAAMYARSTWHAWSQCLAICCAAAIDVANAYIRGCQSSMNHGQAAAHWVERERGCGKKCVKRY
jgi:hypothetical protein